MDYNLETEVILGSHSKRNSLCPLKLLSLKEKEELFSPLVKKRKRGKCDVAGREVRWTRMPP